MDQIPLSHEASAGDTHKQTTDTLPSEVVQCLENARFLHLATCIDNIPHVSLMNYTYLPSSPYSASPVIVMTSNTASKKTTHVAANPNVSLLVHDWVSHRPPPRRGSAAAGSSPPRFPTTAELSNPAAAAAAGGGAGAPSSLAALLLNLNSSAVSSISATIGGSARIVQPGSAEEAFYRRQHLENNTFESSTPRGRYDGDRDNTHTSSSNSNNGGHDEEDLARRRFGSAGRSEEDVRVIVVQIRDVRISDWKGTVRDWVLTPPARGGNELVNGIR